MRVSEKAYRYAIYFCPPPESAWWQAGSSWLGRSAWTGQALEQPRIPGLSETEFAALTADPRRYGWHATLKAPFRLKAALTPQDLQTAVALLAKQVRALPALKLHPVTMGQFIALVPALPSQADEIRRIAQQTVEWLNPLAEPLSAPEIARRRQSGLTPEQDALMLKWGYPYVMDHFKFHLSLTQRLDQVSPATIAQLLASVESHFKDLPDLNLDGLAIFAEPAKGEDFRLVDIVKIG